MNIQTSLNKLIFPSCQTLFSKRPFTHHVFCLFSYSVICILNCLLCSIPFLSRDCKVLCCICGGNNLESNLLK